ncbi:CidA/LrgA family protein [Acidovorax sp.]|uniref:CidA/LrgA family protein n=1 Tax=Acidovorax sp. TaxID=1872122 RepID=UPI00258E5CA0|nr:CidA/LrgA family protein [Acidovorax sp.]
MLERLRVISQAARRTTKWLGAAALLVGLQFLGDAVIALTGWPMPGALVGMLILLAALCGLGRVPESLDDVTTPLLRHLMLFLIPSVAAVGLYAGLLMQHAAVFALTASLVTALTVVATGWTLQRQKRRRTQ